MSKDYKNINPEFVHDFIEVLSQKAEEIQDIFQVFSENETENPLYNFQKLIFPDQDFREMPMGGMTPPVLGPSGFNYKGEEGCDYLYGFTNSEFIAFLGRLCPTEFIIIMTLISILISQPLNLNELSIIALFMEGLGDQLELLAEFRSIQTDIKEEDEQKEQNEAIQQDFNYIFQQLCAMQERINCLENQLSHTDNPCKSPHTPTPCS